jgi:hypothetical protein
MDEAVNNLLGVVCELNVTFLLESATKYADSMNNTQSSVIGK